VIVLSNLNEFSPTELAKRVADLHLSDEFTAGPEPADRRRERPEPPAPVELELSADELGAYAGHYYSAELEVTYIVRPMEGNLTYHLEFSPVDVQLVPTGPDEWYARRVQLGFVRDSNNTVTGLNVSSRRIRNIYFQKTRE
jgi:hypothetical protein